MCAVRLRKGRGRPPYSDATPGLPEWPLRFARHYPSAHPIRSAGTLQACHKVLDNMFRLLCPTLGQSAAVPPLHVPCRGPVPPQQDPRCAGWERPVPRRRRRGRTEAASARASAVCRIQVLVATRHTNASPTRAPAPRSQAYRDRCACYCPGGGDAARNSLQTAQYICGRCFHLRDGGKNRDPHLGGKPEGVSLWRPHRTSPSICP